MLKKYKKENRGFTIIETMIAISIFLIVVTIGMGALLNANLLHKKSQDMRSILDNMSFIMEDMSRNLRTGSNYNCNNGFVPGATNDCSSGGVLAFTKALEGTWAYKVEASDGVLYNISKSIDGGNSWVILNPPEVVINSISGFTVIGAEPPPGNTQQPFVTIRLVGQIKGQNNVITPFSLQTSVSQRLIDR